MLIIDEAQNLTEELLEQVRLLSNIETDDRKLLQIVLLGQPELRDRLNSPRLRQLRQRITVRYHLAPLTRFEVAQYIQHRLELAGAKGVPFFTRPALWRIYHYSGGIPRLVNAVCDKALLAGFVEHSDRINLSHGGPRHPRTGRRHPRMSLINDALKRARENAAEQPAVRRAAIAARRMLPRTAAPAGFWRRRRFCFSPPSCLFIGPACLDSKAPPVMRPPSRRTLPRRRRSRRPRPPLAAAGDPAATNALPLPLPATNAITNPPPPPLPSEPWPKVQGIIFNAARPLAIVNGQTVNAGDRVGDFQVKQILKNSVIFQQPGRLAENTEHRRINPPTIRVRLLEKILRQAARPPASRRFSFSSR